MILIILFLMLQYSLNAILSIFLGCFILVEWCIELDTNSCSVFWFIIVRADIITRLVLVLFIEMPEYQQHYIVCLL